VLVRVQHDQRERKHVAARHVTMLRVAWRHYCLLHVVRCSVVCRVASATFCASQDSPFGSIFSVTFPGVVRGTQ
jgi:hypothetical protein